MTGTVAIEERALLSAGERAMAQRLGLGLAILVAFGCDLVAMAWDRVPANLGPSAWVIDEAGPRIVLLGALLPILAAAPFGWLFGPMVVVARRPGKIAIAVVLAFLTMLFGDVLYVAGSAAVTSLAGPAASAWIGLPSILLLIVLGALLVGPVVFFVATLPAAVVWVCAFRFVWRSMGDPATTR